MIMILAAVDGKVAVALYIGADRRYADEVRWMLLALVTAAPMVAGTACQLSNRNDVTREGASVPAWEQAPLGGDSVPRSDCADCADCTDCAHCSRCGHVQALGVPVVMADLVPPPARSVPAIRETPRAPREPEPSGILVVPKGWALPTR